MGEAEQVGREAEQAGRDAQQSDSVDVAARLGLFAYGVVHLLLAWLIVQLALGDHSDEASAKGAMQQLAEQPFGLVLVWAVAVGMFLLVVWQLLEAGFGHRDVDGGDRVRKRVASVLKAVIYGVLGATGVKVALGSGGSGGSQSLTAKVMDLPAGQWLVAAAGIAVIGYGVGLAWRGWKEKFAEHLDTEGKMGTSGATYLVLGKIGYITKGLSLALVGGLICYAGISHRSGQSGGLDGALTKVLQQPFGPVLLGLIAFGFASYGVFCFARARHLDN